MDLGSNGLEDLHPIGEQILEKVREWNEKYDMGLDESVAMPGGEFWRNLDEDTFVIFIAWYGRLLDVRGGRTSRGLTNFFTPEMLDRYQECVDVGTCATLNVRELVAIEKAVTENLDRKRPDDLKPGQRLKPEYETRRMGPAELKFPFAESIRYAAEEWAAQ